MFEMTDEFPVIRNLAVIDPRPTRRNARPSYPWSKLEPGDGFWFKAGTSVLYARNQAAAAGTQLNRHFQVRISNDHEALQCVRLDGCSYDPARAPDGSLCRPVTDRMIWYPADESLLSWQDRMARDAQLDRLKSAFDKLSLSGLSVLMDEFVAEMVRVADARAALEAAQERADAMAGDGPSDTPDLI
jgi:hypothetical protein